MVKNMVVDGLSVHRSSDLETKDKNVKKSLKRKRLSALEYVSQDDRESRIHELQQELNSLFQYFREISGQKVCFFNESSGGGCSSISMIACFLEESHLPFSILVDEIYEKLKIREGITLAYVRSTVLSVGQRLMYGIANADADVLEDNSETCLWCWETRDLKLIPKIQRGVLSIRRTCRKKIHERVTAVSAMKLALQVSESCQNYRTDLMKASERLDKVLNEAEIRLLVENMVQKNAADMAEKEAKLKERELIKGLERNKREVKKEKKRMEREVQKEKLQSEKESKRLQDEAEKEERRREREEAEMKKQLKRQLEEAEKDQRRREKEEAELKKQLAMQKQASMMERFLKNKKNNSPSQDGKSSTKETAYDYSWKKDEMLNSVALSMDNALSLKDGISTVELFKSHRSSWCYSCRSNRSQHWGIRCKPKSVLIKELKLTSNKGVECGDDLDKLVNGWEETVSDDRSGHDSADDPLTDIRKHNSAKKLLQFDKSYRPAFYGIWPKKSHVVGPRHPLKKDPDLDYDIDSEEEWEEEEPGESLSDCDKDDEEESVDEGNLRADDEDGSEDGFFVPDGYLSENEGVQVDRMESDIEEARSSPSYKQDSESEEVRTFLRLHKYLHNLTESALRKNQPLIISNLMHEKSTLLVTEDIDGPKLEVMCLQALRMQAFPEASPMEISKNKLDVVDCISQTQGKDGTAPRRDVTVIPDTALPKFVSAIQSSPCRIRKVVDSLQQTFPAVPKSQLKSKVHEISEFLDNRWQVKKEILDKLGPSISPEKSSGRPQGIARFFSKRCLPPDGETTNARETPQSCCKPDTLHSIQQSTENLLQGSTIS
ncbi:chromatin assembly factor 1 subunit FAS1 [Macadamia integrifolia]|uniref:chromatin assembly factor 1 subunit FAS1 n=1 Tax=Macadamia integrifolia TaxID=60698 RepID=UPI001C527504|nr:chromatin assembly factor 1 subunit FAS1 [Macadamia integrifolia]